jgi:Zn-dependent M16 (insulinase) family peptidase
VDPSTPIQFKGIVYNEMKGQTVRVEETWWVKETIGY